MIETEVFSDNAMDLTTLLTVLSDVKGVTSPCACRSPGRAWPARSQTRSTT